MHIKIMSRMIAVGILCGIGLVGAHAYGDEASQRKAEELRQEVNGWISDAKATYRLDCQSMEELWDAYCGADWEPTEEPDKEAARAVADKIQSRMRERIDDALLRRHDDLRRRAEDLKKDDTQAAAERILADIQTEYDRLTKLKDSGAWRGSNHPLVQYAIEYGKQEHIRMAASSSYACQVVDKAIPGSSMRPDCISATNCMIYEFKPDNRRAKDRGETQLDGYHPAVTAYYQKLIDQEKTSADPDLGGEEIMTKLRGQCMSGSSVTFKRKVEPYYMCEKKYQCTE